MFWFRGKGSFYDALSGEDPKASEESDDFLTNEWEEDEGVNNRELGKKNNLTSVLIALTVIISVVNIALFIHQSTGRFPSNLPSASPSPDLKLASTFIGFGKLYASSSTEFNYSIENMPLTVHSVDREYPDTVRPDETPHRWTLQGTVVPDRRHIFINETISTIVQFRALDYGFEVCQPTITLSTSASLANSTIKSEGDEPRSYRLSAPSVLVQVWALESINLNGRELELDLSRLTYANRPQRKMQLGTIEVQDGVQDVVANAFVCESGTLHTLELSCETPGCMLDFWTDEVEPRTAFFVKQSSA